MIAILRRYTSDGRIYRVLDCGQEHAVIEPNGGKASQATHVLGCQACNVAKVRPEPGPVIGTCTAIVMNPKLRRTHVCGQPARLLKRGMPRCAYHFSRGAR